MRSVVFALTIVTALSLAMPRNASADGTCPTPAPSTWGSSATSASNANATPTDAPATVDEPVARARDLLSRARLLDEAAAADEKAATEITARLPTLRSTAKVAREKADRASGEDRETLVSRAEDLEADVAISEAETTSKRRAAIDNRRVARELRTRAVRIVREAPTESKTVSSCDPPYRYTADGRKTYRIECLK